MHKEFQMSVRKSITGVHITLEGGFSGNDMFSFRNVINDAHKEGARIFLDVRELQPMNDESREKFRTCYAHVPAQNIYFKGKEGEKLGMQGNRILFMKSHECKCAGACKSCACEKRAQNRNTRFDFFQKAKSAHPASKQTSLNQEKN